MAFSFSLFDVTLVCNLFSIVVYVYYSQRYIKNWTKPSHLFALSFLIVNFQLLIDCRIGLRSADSFLYPHTLNLCVILGTIGFSAFVSGFLFYKSYKNRTLSIIKEQKRIDNSILAVLQIVFFAGFILTAKVSDLVTGSAYSGGIERESSAADYFEALLFICNVLLVANIVNSNTNFKGFFSYVSTIPLPNLLIIAIYLVLRLLSGDRGPFIYTILLFFFGYLYATRKHIKFSYVLLSFFAGSIFVSIVGIARGLDTKLSFSERMSNASVTFSEEGRNGEDMKSFFEPTSELAGSLHVSQIVLNECEQHNRPILYGKNILSQFLNCIPFVSRLLNEMGIKARDVNSSAFANYYYLGEFRTWGVGTNIIADFYLAFGVFGVFLGMFIVGYFFNYLDHILFKEEKGDISIYALSMALIFSAHSIYIPRSTFFGEVKGVIWAFAIIYVLRVLGAKKSDLKQTKIMLR